MVAQNVGLPVHTSKCYGAGATKERLFPKIPFVYGKDIIRMLHCGQMVEGAESVTVF